jgi:hypothetical protein
VRRRLLIATLAIGCTGAPAAKDSYDGILPEGASVAQLDSQSKVTDLKYAACQHRAHQLGVRGADSANWTLYCVHLVGPRKGGDTSVTGVPR